MPSKPITCICEQCGVSFLCRPTSLQGHRGRFCSLACWYVWRAAETRRTWWQRVDKSGECWLWTGAKTAFGHGKITFSGKGWAGTHRLSWEQHYGPIPEGQCVLHHCDVPSCVRPSHLYLGTLRDNNHDTWQRGRSAFQPNWWAGRKRISRNGKALPL